MCFCSIAKALGPERTRDELIPFLAGILFYCDSLVGYSYHYNILCLIIAESLDDEDEVLVVIADKLGETSTCCLNIVITVAPILYIYVYIYHRV